MTNKDQDVSDWPEFPSSIEFWALVYDTTDFGLSQLTVKDAAVLIATDLWFEGENFCGSSGS